MSLILIINRMLSTHSLLYKSSMLLIVLLIKMSLLLMLSRSSMKVLLRVIRDIMKLLSKVILELLPQELILMGLSRKLMLRLWLKRKMKKLL